jgi:hypothetical protein
MIAWDSVEAHTRHRGTPTHNAMREATARYQTQKSNGGYFMLHEAELIRVNNSAPMGRPLRLTLLI